MSATIKTDAVVSFTYVIRDNTGEICEYRDLPVAYIHGGQSPLFPQIERALEGRTVGHRAVVTLSAQEAFGEHDPSLTFIDVLDNVPQELRYVGAEFEAENEQGDRRQFRVTKTEDGRLTVDANHPLAGKALTYEVTVVGIRKASDEELRTGQAELELSAVQ
jgi:FKBP-type peptidyl-prolyl cis-trans isomerase SlyD